MSVRGHCPRCGVPIEFEPEHAGASVPCPACREVISLAADPAPPAKPSPPDWELRDTAPEPRLSAGETIPELARKQAEEAALERAQREAMAAHAASQVRSKRLAITLETTRRESAYGALRGLIGLMAVAGYVFAGLLVLAGLLAIGNPEAGLVFGIPAALVMFGIGAAVAFLTRASEQAALILVDIADCNVRILVRLNEMNARSEGEKLPGSAPAAILPIDGPAPAKPPPPAG